MPTSRAMRVHVRWHRIHSLFANVVAKASIRRCWHGPNPASEVLRKDGHRDQLRLPRAASPGRQGRCEERRSRCAAEGRPLAASREDRKCNPKSQDTEPKSRRLNRRPQLGSQFRALSSFGLDAKICLGFRKAQLVIFRCEELWQTVV